MIMIMISVMIMIMVTIMFRFRLRFDYGFDFGYVMVPKHYVSFTIRYDYVMVTRNLRFLDNTFIS
jgi:hypothetical protein